MRSWHTTTSIVRLGSPNANLHIQGEEPARWEQGWAPLKWREWKNSRLDRWQLDRTPRDVLPRFVRTPLVAEWSMRSSGWVNLRKRARLAKGSFRCVLSCCSLRNARSCEFFVELHKFQFINIHTYTGESTGFEVLRVLWHCFGLNEKETGAQEVGKSS